MRSLFILMLLAVVVTACNTTRQLISSTDQHSSDSMLSVNHVDSTHATTDTMSIVISNSAQTDEAIVLEVIEYDTTLPLDTTTGLAPIKKKSIYQRNTTTKAEQSAKAERANLETSTVQRADSVRTIKLSTRQQTITDERETRSPLGLWSVLASLVVGLLLIAYLYFRR